MKPAPTRSYLEDILARKRREVHRRRSHLVISAAAFADITHDPERGAAGVRALRRPPEAPPRVIAEVKFRSPSRGQIRERTPGEVVRVAQAYAANGAAAVSVLADRVGFDGSPLDVRRVARSVAPPVLFKGFVIDETQVELARACGASLVLLLVRALSPERLDAMVVAVQRAGMEPVVEAADAREVEAALSTSARIVGVNARDLSTFELDPIAARAALDEIPQDRVAVYMSGVSDRASFDAVSRGRADAVLIGEALMRAPEPGLALADLLV